MKLLKRLRRLAAAVLAPLLLFGCAVPEPEAPAELPDGSTRVYYFDAGQGDSALIRLADGRNILIDASTPDCGKLLSEQLKKLGVQKLDVLIGTHPHADHVGGMYRVVKDFEIGEVYLPRTPEGQTPTTQSYENLLKALDEKGCSVTQARAGLTVLTGEGVKLELLAPVGTEYDELNNYSAVCMLTVGERRFLFTGDAEKLSENEMLDSGVSLAADVLKVGHHGSLTSTTAAFVKAVAPSYAVISCGRDNSYGYPKKATLSRLEREGAKIFRTDLQGTILAVSDGREITFETGLPRVTPN